jgi:excisionase family DNA binding protein
MRHSGLQADFPKALLTASEAAEFLRINRTHLYRLSLPYVLVGKRRRWRLEDINSWLESRVVRKEALP